jgi:enoyl-CoA hydratase
MMEYKTLIFDVNEQIATVILNRPEKLTALNETLRNELEHVCAHISNEDEIRCVIFTGSGRGFALGQI